MTSDGKTGDAPRCGLYLRLPQKDLATLVPMLRDAAFVINRSRYQTNMHVVEIPPAGNGLVEDERQPLTDLVQKLGLVALTSVSAADAQGIGADGVILSRMTDLETARALLGQAAIIGVACDNIPLDESLASRVDCIRLTDQAAMIPHLQRWSTMTDVPAIASAIITNHNAGFYTRAGATFLDCSDYVWGYDKGVKQAVVNMLHAIELSSGSEH